MAAFASAVNSPTSAFSEASPAGLLSTVSASNASSEPPSCTIDSEPLRLPLAVFYSLFFVLGLAGNLFALWVFLFLHSSRNSVRVLLINCAVADLVLLASLPFRAFYHVNGDRWLLGSVACRFVGNIFYMNMYMSIVLLGLISLDRYLRLSGSGRSRRSTRLRPLWSWAACGALWALFLAMSLTLVSTPEDKSLDGTCFQFKKRIASRWKAYINLTVVLMFWLVFVLLVVSYAKIASRLLQVFKNQPDFPNASKYKQTAKKSFFVLFLFTVCFVPYHTFRPFYILTQMDYFKSCTAQQLADRTNEVTLLFSVFNSCLDPVMYFLLSGSVRRMALRVVGRRLAGRLQRGDVGKLRHGQPAGLLCRDFRVALHGRDAAGAICWPTVCMN
uniref:Probable G-protein coupled receptor 34 n=1 Tax=Kryptolebias marmoratus TaxID=37003 RepID=A0A3Q3FPE3_KRYMA